MSNYTELANKFLDDTHTDMVVGKPAYKRHFADDTQCRYVFPVKFYRYGKMLTVRFGQSIAAGCTEPTAYDVLSCLTKYDPGEYTEFCSAFGYNPELRESGVVYRAVCREWAGVERVWGDVIDQLREIE